ncbi:hypothetical protein B7463_g5955, partial [Scytalidium lignicola]
MMCPPPQQPRHCRFGIMSPEECLCRRSNLYTTLITPAPGNSALSNYPIPPKAGIFSEHLSSVQVHKITRSGKNTRRNAFLRDPEFVGWFRNIMFAFDPVGEGPKSSPSSKAKSSSSNGKEKSTATSDLEVFKHIFKLTVIHNAFKP